MKYIKHTILLAIVALLVFAGYKFVYQTAFESGLAIGHYNGQIDLIIDLTNKIDEKINDKTNHETYYFHKYIYDIPIYIYTKNGVKTIAVWDDGEITKEQE